MARKTCKITIESDDRDNGKQFFITEKPVTEAHAWAQNALFALLNAGVAVPQSIRDSGMAGIAAMGITNLGVIPPAIGIPLASELLECVEIIPDKSKPSIRLPLTKEVIDGNVEEVTTIFHLQKEVLFLHMGFSTPASP